LFVLFVFTFTRYTVTAHLPAVHVRSAALPRYYLPACTAVSHRTYLQLRFYCCCRFYTTILTAPAVCLPFLPADYYLPFLPFTGLYLLTVTACRYLFACDSFVYCLPARSDYVLTITILLPLPTYRSTYRSRFVLPAWVVVRSACHTGYRGSNFTVFTATVTWCSFVMPLPFWITVSLFRLFLPATVGLRYLHLFTVSFLPPVYSYAFYSYHRSTVRFTAVTTRLPFAVSACHLIRSAVALLRITLPRFYGRTAYRVTVTAFIHYLPRCVGCVTAFYLHLVCSVRSVAAFIPLRSATVLPFLPFGFYRCSSQLCRSCSVDYLPFVLQFCAFWFLPFCRSHHV